MTEPCKILDLRGVARHCKVHPLTPQQWRQRGLLPPVDYPEITGCPLWRVATIKEWAYRSGRNFWDVPGDEATLNDWDDIPDLPPDTDKQTVPGLAFSHARGAR